MTSGPTDLYRNLADDLGWLEEHARTRAETAPQSASLRFAAALVRNLVAPASTGGSASPLHLAVVGGAGTGKSTIANLLCGAVVAEANPQAGFTRHPVAYVTAARTLEWTTSDGFLGPLTRRIDATSSNLHEDVYQIRTVPAEHDATLLHRFVVWDCPDMTTWAASGYAPRLLEVAALADVIVYVASDERYNDAVPTEYLRLLLASGKPVVVVLTKMKPENAAALTEHFRKEVLSKLPRGRVAILTVPQLTAEELANPSTAAAQYRIPLVNQIAVLGEVPDQLRRQSVQAAVNYLRNSQDELLAVARDDVAAMEEWSKLIRSAQAEFEDRYRREFLTTAKFHRFDEALVKLIDLLEIPGAGKYVTATLYVVRTPYRLLKGFMGKMFAVPGLPAIPEQPVLESAFSAWMDRVQATALAQAKKHDLWARVSVGFAQGVDKESQERFRAGLRDFQAGQTDEIDRTARAIYEDLEKSPGTLKALRGSKLALDVVAIGGSIVMGGITAWDFVTVPLAAAISQQLVEWVGASYVDMQREQARQRQSNLVHRFVSQPIANWLAQWPLTGGTPYERLKQILERVPRTLMELRIP
ncbi:MAG: GTPase domain-containing protein [Gemmataceae bacterium]